MSKEGRLGDIWCYHGSKGRYLDNILSVIPDRYIKADCKVLDLFTGGSSVATSLPINWNVVANDIEVDIIRFSVQLQQMLGAMSPQEVEAMVKSYCHGWVSSRKDKEGYQTLKDSYNNGEITPMKLFALVMSSNSNMIRFNKKGEFNLNFGDRFYNSNSSKKMLAYLTRLKEREVTFTSKDFSEFKDREKFDIHIIDPPYSTSKATYSEKGQWTLKKETDLLSMCDLIDKRGKKFIYFNQTFTQDTENKVVNMWKDRYNHLVLRDTSTGCSAQRKNTGKTEEIMVHNF